VRSDLVWSGRVEKEILLVLRLFLFSFDHKLGDGDGRVWYWNNNTATDEGTTFSPIEPTSQPASISRETAAIYSQCMYSSICTGRAFPRSSLGCFQSTTSGTATSDTVHSES
jgi:hypothetical protein